MLLFFFFFNDTATTEIYTLSLHDALPICSSQRTQADHLRNKHEGGDDLRCLYRPENERDLRAQRGHADLFRFRSEEHTSELQSRLHLVCRLLLEKKKKTTTTNCMCNS